MNVTLEQPTPRYDLIQALRDLAVRGATVRQLVGEVYARLGYEGDVVVPVLWYFTQAFGLPLTEVLPIREWLGTARDEEINALILPAIEKARSHWMSSAALHSNGPGTGGAGDRGLLATDQGS